MKTQREEYLEMRKSKSYDVNWFYKYYIQNGGNIGLHDFLVMFQMGSLDEVIRFIDYKLKVNVIVDKEGREVWFS